MDYLFESQSFSELFFGVFFIAIYQLELTDSMSSVRHYSSTLRSLGLSVFVSESITTYIIHSTLVLGKCCQSRTYAVS